MKSQKQPRYSLERSRLGKAVPGPQPGVLAVRLRKALGGEGA